MNRVRRATLAAALALASATLHAPAQAFAPSINWWTVDGGGNGYSKAATYNLAGTSGQPDAGLLTASPFKIQGGFWGKGALIITAVETPDPTDPTHPESDTDAPKVARVLPAAPNPTGSAVRFPFEVPNERAVVIRVYNITGALVRTLAQRAYPAGRHAVTWDGRGSGGALVAQGVYVVRVRLGSLERSQKLLILR